MRQRSIQSGFTLLELVLVLVVISTVLAMAAPSLRGWHKGSKLKDAAADFISLTEMARTAAMSSMVVHRLVVDQTNARCYVAKQQIEQFEEIPGELARVAIPDGFRIDLTDTSGTRRESVDFFPNGRTQTARVRVTSPDGDVADIECATPTEGYRAVKPGEVR